MVKCELADSASLGVFRCGNLNVRIFPGIFLEPTDSFAAFSFIIWVFASLPYPFFYERDILNMMMIIYFFRSGLACEIEISKKGKSRK